MGGFSICDAFTCILTCGLIYRKKPEDGGPSADELDFRKRFEKSMDKNSGDLGFGQVKKRKARERKGKDMSNYLSSAAKNKKAGKGNGSGTNSMNGDIEGAEQNRESKFSKCHACCCIVFCCMDANIYYGEEKYS